MSATNRGTTRDPKDFYATPMSAFEPLLAYLPTDVVFWEPCCGDARLIKRLRAAGRQADGADLFPQPQWACPPIDYLKDDTPRDFVITNPPFSVAFAMCKHARKYSKEFMFLLRLAFLESEERGDWLVANEPSALFVLRKRPSFVMSITCKNVLPAEWVKDPGYPNGGFSKPPVACKHNWLLPIESDRPTVCPKCGGDELAISTSDNAGYAWMYFGTRYKGIFHI